ncbi:MAG: arginine--tRNA ligase [Calditrichia bacterium]
MKSLRKKLTAIVSSAFETAGFSPTFGGVEVSNRPDLGQFQCNGALPAAKEYKKNPREIGQSILDILIEKDEFSEVSLAGPGFINLKLTDEYLSEHMREVVTDERLGCSVAEDPLKIIIDYGGANIAKPLHVGHLRAAIIGECLKRLARFLGHDVTGDVHLGDWGLQMGMVISELQRREPNLPYFDSAFSGSYPKESPVTPQDLEEIYPAASALAKSDEAAKEAARLATFELQEGRKGYRALWQHIFDVSVDDLKTDYSKLNIEFDLWLGESHTQDRIPALIEKLKADGWAKESRGALVINVAREDDNKDIPPLMLLKSDGAVVYGTTDLATIEQRVEDYNPDLVLYVVDKRQSDHFVQVFRGAYKSGTAPESLKLEHLGFGTMNGKDGSPFKTREGGVMKLKDLIAMVAGKARERMEEAEIGKEYSDEEKDDVARMIGVATLKYADLMNQPTKDYVFDLDRFSSFDGRTGPYLLYTSVRIKSILRKAEERGFHPGRLHLPTSDVERQLMLKISELPEVLALGFENRLPNYLCEYVYNLGVHFNRFYHEHHILREEDKAKRDAWLTLSQMTLSTLVLVIDLLGIEVPERM